MRRLPLWARWAAVMLPLVSGAWGVVHALSTKASTFETKLHADSTYERRDSAAITHLRDSLNYRADMHDVRALLFHLDSDFHHPGGRR